MESRFHALAELVGCYRPIWSERPFYTRTPAWTRHYPELSTWLLTLGDSELQSLEADTDALITALSPHLPNLEALTTLTELPPLPLSLPEIGKRLNVAVPGRKWAQVTAFAAALQRPDGEVLEWCSGKGHLARLLSGAWRVPARAVERRQDLCTRGATLAARDGADVTFDCRDILTITPSELAAAGSVVALHACGDLHTTLLHRAAIGGVASLALAPCCYHLTAKGNRPWLSQAAQPYAPAINREDLRLIAMETVVAGRRTVRRRDRLNRWRLGFDCLQRQLRGIDAYLPIPPLPPTLADGDFATFCNAAAAAKGIALPDAIDYASFEAAGNARFNHTRRLSLVRHPFRRPLEVALLLDYALFLDEHGYDCRVGTFCDKSLTPRNLCLIARRR